MLRGLQTETGGETPPMGPSERLENIFRPRARLPPPKHMRLSSVRAQRASPRHTPQAHHAGTCTGALAHWLPERRATGWRCSGKQSGESPRGEWELGPPPATWAAWRVTMATRPRHSITAFLKRFETNMSSQRPLLSRPCSLPAPPPLPCWPCCRYLTRDPWLPRAALSPELHGMLHGDPAPHMLPATLRSGLQ